MNDVRTAQHVVKALLEDRENPKRIFKRMRLTKHWQPPPVHVEDCREWLEWDDLEDWQRTAVLEFQDVEGESAYERHENDRIDVAQKSKEFTIYQDEDAATMAAEIQVASDIENEPSLFGRNFMERFINIDRLRNDLRPGEEEATRDQYDHEWSDYEEKRDGLIEQDKLEYSDFHDENHYPLEITPELERMIDQAYEDWIEDQVTRRLSDPLGFLREIFGYEEAIETAIRIAGIDVQAAASEAVSIDGWEHYLAHSDGNSYSLPSGAVYVRTN